MLDDTAFQTALRMTDDAEEAGFLLALQAVASRVKPDLHETVVRSMVQTEVARGLDEGDLLRLAKSLGLIASAPLHPMAARLLKAGVRHA